jgi:hypothetical protein
MAFQDYIKLLIQRPQIIPGSTIGNWNSGVAPSGAAGAALVTIGAAGQWYRLNQFTIVTVGFNAAATVYVRCYMDVAGVNRLVIDDDYTMPQEIVFLSWWFDAEFYGPFRVEIFSDQAADDGLNVIYEYRIKDW